jgi:hypothetical protein
VSRIGTGVADLASFAISGLKSFASSVVAAPPPEDPSLPKLPKWFPSNLADGKPHNIVNLETRETPRIVVAVDTSNQDILQGVQNTFTNQDGTPSKPQFHIDKLPQGSLENIHWRVYDGVVIVSPSEMLSGNAKAFAEYAKRLGIDVEIVVASENKSPLLAAPSKAEVAEPKLALATTTTGETSLGQIEPLFSNEFWKAKIALLPQRQVDTAVDAAPLPYAPSKVCTLTGMSCLKTYADGFPQHPKYAFVPMYEKISTDKTAFEEIVQLQNTPDTMPEVNVLPWFKGSPKHLTTYFEQNKLWEYDAIFLQYDHVMMAGFKYLTEQAHKYGIPVVVLRTKGEWSNAYREFDKSYHKPWIETGPKATYKAFEKEIVQNELSTEVLPVYVCDLQTVSDAMSRQDRIASGEHQEKIASGQHFKRDQTKTTSAELAESFTESDKVCGNFDNDALAWSVNAKNIKRWSETLRGVAQIGGAPAEKLGAPHTRAAAAGELGAPGGK